MRILVTSVTTESNDVFCIVIISWKSAILSSLYRLIIRCLHIDNAVRRFKERLPEFPDDNLRNRIAVKMLPLAASEIIYVLAYLCPPSSCLHSSLSGTEMSWTRVHNTSAGRVKYFKGPVFVFISRPSL